MVFILIISTVLHQAGFLAFSTKPGNEAITTTVQNAISPYILNALKARTFSAIACPPLDTQCGPNPMINGIKQEMANLANDGVESCVRPFINSNETKSNDQLPASFNFQLGVMTNCQLTLQDRTIPSYKASIHLSMGDAKFQEYVKMTENFDKLNTSTVQDVKLVSTQDSTYNITFQNTDKNPKKYFWDFKSDLLTSEGSFDSPLTFDLVDNEDFSDSIENYFNNELTSAGFTLETGDWTVDVNGKLNANIAFNWKKDVDKQIDTDQFTKLSFCSTTCVITLDEKQHIKANKVATVKDNYIGTLESTANHWETYTGTGNGDINSRSVSWTNDLGILKTHSKDYQVDFKSTDWQKLQYHEKIDSTGAYHPYSQTGLFNATTDKSLIAVPIPPAVADNLDYVIAGYDISEHKFEKRKDLVDTTLLDQNGEGSFNKTIYSKNKSTPFSYSGNYDVLSDLLKITESSDNKVYEIGSRRDPFSDVAPNTFQHSLTGYIQDSFQVPGFFNSSTPNASVAMGASNIKSAPKYIAIIDNSGGDVNFAKTLTSAKEFAKEMRTLGVSVQEYTPKSGDEFINILTNLESGTWLVNIGHGIEGGEGLVTAGQPVYWSDIHLALNVHHVRLDVFLADSCYAARLPIGQVALRSLSTGINTDDQVFGSIFGIDGHSYHTTNADFAKGLQDMLGCTKNNIQPAPDAKPSNGVLPKSNFPDTINPLTIP